MLRINYRKSSNGKNFKRSEVTELMKKITGFLKAVIAEMRKVSWPKKKELKKYTIVVIATVVFMAVYFGVVDFAISQVMDWYIAL